ncbi:hypothetical protein HFP71_24470 [Streptomyces sp. ARC32]
MAVNAGTRKNGTEGERRRAAQGEGAERGGPAKPGQASGTRRQVMRGLLAPALAVGLAPLVAASRPARATEAAAGAGDAAGPAHPGPHAAGSAP